MRVWCPRRISEELVGSHAGLLPGRAARWAHMTGLTVTRGLAHTPGILLRGVGDARSMKMYTEDIIFITVAISPTAGRIPKVVRLFTLRQSTNQILSYKAGNDEVFSLFQAETD